LHLNWTKKGTIAVVSERASLWTQYNRQGLAGNNTSR
jgi:hypothetical protein